LKLNANHTIALEEQHARCGQIRPSVAFVSCRAASIPLETILTKNIVFTYSLTSGLQNDTRNSKIY
jgi:hypothetical protein